MKRFFCVVVFLTLIPSFGASQDGCGWLPGFNMADLDFFARGSVVFDDGSGPALYVGGAFITVGGVVVNRIAKWDGTAWSALNGPSEPGMDGQVYDLAVFDDGSGPALYAGGYFSTAGGVPVNNIARWDGSAWSALDGTSGTGRIEAFQVFDDGSGAALFAGGYFTTAGGVTVNNIAKWNGTVWSALTGPSGTGTSDDVKSLAVYDDGGGKALYVGGIYVTAGGVTVNNIAKWDGSVWSALSGPSGVGTGGTFPWVNALNVYDDGTGSALYATGRFTSVGGVGAEAIAKWNGTSWSALGSGLSGSNQWVRALTTYDDGTGEALYAGGDFTSAGGLPAVGIAKWDGSLWSDLSGASGTGLDKYAITLTVFDEGDGPALFAAGNFTAAGDGLANKVARWHGGEWSALNGNPGFGTNGYFSAFVEYDDGAGAALCGAGSFTGAGEVEANSIARWRDGVWSALIGPSGNGINWKVGALTVYDDGSGDALYAGGEFATAGGVTTKNIAMWDGSSWSPLTGPSSNGMTNTVNALAVYDDGTGSALYAGGKFAKAGGVRVNKIGTWDGTAWSDLSGPSGNGMDDWVYALAVFDDRTGPALYAGGVFTTAGGITANHIARWDGSSWSDLSGPSGNGINGDVNALVVFDDGTGDALYAGGDFTSAGGETTNFIAKWDGDVWSALDGPSDNGMDAEVNALTVYDDGTGPLLYAGAFFSTAGGVVVNGIARWDGMTWTDLSGPLQTGVNSTIRALAGFDDGNGSTLYAGGYFTTAGGIPSNGIAAWCCDFVSPTDPAVLWSPSHTVSQWSSADIVEVEWSGATDIGCSGLAGYSVQFDTSPTTEPDILIDVEHISDPHVTTSVSLVDGDNHYFHLRTCDNGGSCSAGMHLGPLWIDTMAPSGPFDLLSTSHSPGVPSCDRSVDMVWTSAHDAGSGLNGYASAVTTSALWTCDQVMDLPEGALSLTTGDLANGFWYVHLCAQDNLGHWGEVVSAGPYPSCQVFADGFETGDTSLWSAVAP